MLARIAVYLYLVLFGFSFLLQPTELAIAIGP